MAQGAPAFSEIEDDLRPLLEGVHLASYNSLQYDVPLLKAEHARCGLGPLPGPRGPGPPGRRAPGGDVPQESLGDVFPVCCRMCFGRKPEETCTAIADVRPTCKVLKGQSWAYELELGAWGLGRAGNRERRRQAGPPEALCGGRNYRGVRQAPGHSAEALPRGRTGLFRVDLRGDEDALASPGTVPLACTGPSGLGRTFLFGHRLLRPGRRAIVIRGRATSSSEASSVLFLRLPPLRGKQLHREERIGQCQTGYQCPQCLEQAVSVPGFSVNAVAKV